MRNTGITVLYLLFACLSIVGAQEYNVKSPNGKLVVTVNVGETLNWKIDHDGTGVLQPSVIAMQGQEMRATGKEMTFGKSMKVSRASANPSRVLSPLLSIKRQVWKIYIMS